ncbi:MAG: hypothetical protein MJE77_42640 [Proteobacteria bacterium]|nr:hypothetical protein [Pseudomonadota bacterium]
MWLNFASDGSGNGKAQFSANHLARPEAQSIVIHNYKDSAERLACIELQ